MGTNLELHEVSGINKIVDRLGGFVSKNEKIILNGKRYTFPSDLVSVEDHLIAIDKELGSGVAGTVFSGYDFTTETRVAVKRITMPEEKYKADWIKGRVINQVTATKASREDVLGPRFSPKGYGFFVMPLAETSLDKIQWSTLEASKVKGIIRDILLQLKAFHSKGFIHMDIKMDNILMTKGKAFLADFSECRTNGVMFQTLHGKQSDYPQMPPEVFMGANIMATPSIDVYSVGFLITCIFKYAPRRTDLLGLRALASKMMDADFQRRPTVDYSLKILG